MGKYSPYVLLFTTIIFLFMGYCRVYGQSKSDTIITVKKIKDFNLQGNGVADNWSKAKWVNLPLIRGKESEEYHTKVKTLYSDTGIYFLFECKDQILTATKHKDFEKLWKQDVVEVFLWPDETVTDYFEYELSPLNHELPLLLAERKDYSARWIPFQYYDSRRQTRHKTFVEGGNKKSGATITKWMAETFIPYKLLLPLNNISPKSGTKWRANLYRIDYDKKQIRWWAWQPINKSFHEYNRFGTFVFD